MLIRAAVLGIAVLMLVSLVIYGVSVYVEDHVLTLGKETRVLQEDNQDLHISLDRLRSYQNVAQASAQIQGLQTATQVIDVAALQHETFTSPKAPVPSLPERTYGY